MDVTKKKAMDSKLKGQQADPSKRKDEPICYECKEIGHMHVCCPVYVNKLKKSRTKKSMVVEATLSKSDEFTSALEDVKEQYYIELALMAIEENSSEDSKEMWISHDKFMGVVSEVWNANSDNILNPLIRLQVKLKNVKKMLKLWNKEVFCHVSQMVRLAAEEAERLQGVFDETPSEDNRVAMFATNAKLHIAMNKEEVFWKQKSRVDWLMNGDRNTTFYHATVNCNRKRSFIHRLKINGSGGCCSDPEVLRKEAVSFFQTLLSSDDHVLDPRFLCYIPSLITSDQNDKLCKSPSAEDVKDVVFSMDGSSAPGLDGFSGMFFAHCWNIICNDVVAAVQGFSAGHKIDVKC
ncbi:hypothetical protein Taro_042937 [Colocasia esculenta]|uniref:Uncharacterized protein n=1 Tax=Colocasia esculenta TaxID=4460 RepID=A0A843WXS7_COLES|nr:hypothetical protein [Colocasia esculenta]